MHCLFGYFICERKFYAGTHVKITRYLKSTLRRTFFEHEHMMPIPMTVCVFTEFTECCSYSLLMVNYYINSVFMYWYRNV